MLKKKRNSKRRNFVEILDFKHLNFFLKKQTVVLQICFVKISDPYNKTTQKF